MKFFPISSLPKAADDMDRRVYLRNGPDVWMGWRDETGWCDAATVYKASPLANPPRVPTEWAPALPQFTVPLPEQLDLPGKQLLAAFDEEKLPVQGGMWAHSPNIGDGFMRIAPDGKLSGYPRPFGWKYLAVTPDIPLVRKRLPDIFRSGKVSQAMVIDDVDVVGPNDPMFQLLAKWVKVNINGGRAAFKGSQHVWNLLADDGSTILCEMRCNAVVYRSLKTVDGSDFVRRRATA